MTVALSAPAASAPSLPVPADFAAKLDTAVAEGMADANIFASEHTPAERWMVPEWALLKMAWPPKTDDEELKFLHAVAQQRTPEGIAAARYFATRGLIDEWETLLKQHTSKVSAVQARAASKLLHDALAMVNNITQVGKAAAGRKRPFVVDPTLPLAVDKPGGSPSYPSGHSSAAYAACLVLAHLMPERKAEFMKLAAEASWARVYSGVHFPTDVLAGAKIASTVVSYLTVHSQAVPTKSGGASPGGLGGRRAALDGAATLAGARLAEAATLTPAA